MKIFETRVYYGAGGYKNYKNSSTPIQDYIVNNYLFGILINSVTVKDFNPDEGNKIWKDKIHYIKQD